ncbi:MAG: hypothetical protein LBB53_01055 [Prevotellaceae bacterium]|nr:hypothetical protein [Prevotellaceae bacterium]
MKKPQIHIGNLIEKQVKKQTMSVSAFAEKIGCIRENAYNIFRLPSIDINRLIKIGEVLNYDFVKEICLQQNKIKIPPTEITLNISLSNIQNEQQYNYLLLKLKEINAFFNSDS